MSFPRYKSYKESGMEWLEEVPAHWEIAPFCSVAAERKEPNIGMLEENLLSLSYGRIVQKDINSNDGLLPESFETYQIVRQGDIVFRLTDLQNDKRSLRTAIVENTGIITSAYVAVTPINIKPSYLSRLLRAYDVAKVFYSMGGGLRQSMKFSDLKRLPTLLPPPDEQSTIATFLDRETAKIDALIVEQQRLIELLKEKRQAIISHAVTKGLNLDVQMKDSGIKWLGVMPAHWGVKPLKFVVSMKSGEQITANDIGDEGSYPVFGGNGLRGYTSNFTHEGYFPLIGRQGALCGNINYGKGKFWASEHAVVASPLLKCSILWLGETLRTMNLGQYSITAAQPGLSVGAIGNLRIPFPPLSEQIAIATFLDREATKLDALVVDVKRAISLLQERRTALISAAVTGKIDVREVTAAQLEKEVVT
jgi:type I restriction enzyme S subunit